MFTIRDELEAAVTAKSHSICMRDLRCRAETTGGILRGGVSVRCPFHASVRCTPHRQVESQGKRSQTTADSMAAALVRRTPEADTSTTEHGDGRQGEVESCDVKFVTQRKAIGVDCSMHAS